MKPQNEIVTVDQEEALADIETMTDVERYSSGGTDVVRGVHPKYGPVIVIFPLSGQAINIPIPAFLEAPITEIRNATL